MQAKIGRGQLPKDPKTFPWGVVVDSERKCSEKSKQNRMMKREKESLHISTRKKNKVSGGEDN